MIAVNELFRPPGYLHFFARNQCLVSLSMYKLKNKSILILVNVTTRKRETIIYMIGLLYTFVFDTILTN